jgi:hypothetical protein
VLDAFSGSSRTLVAAALAGRRYISIGREEKYVRLTGWRLAGVETYLPQHRPPSPQQRDFSQFHVRIHSASRQKTRPMEIYGERDKFLGLVF